MLLKRLIQLVTILPLSFSTMAQPPAPKPIPPQYELENIKLNNKEDIGLFFDINDDSRGNLWLSGNKGLHVFDGNHIISYTSGKKQYSLLPDSALRVLHYIEKETNDRFIIQEERKRILQFDTRLRKVTGIIDEKKDTADEMYLCKIGSNDILYTLILNNKSNIIFLFEKKQNQPARFLYKTVYNMRNGFTYRLTANHNWLIYQDVVKRISLDGKEEKEYILPGGIAYSSNINDNRDEFYIINGRQDAVYKWNSVKDTMELFSALPAAVIKNTFGGFYVWGNNIYLGSNRFCYIINRQDNTYQDLSPDFLALVKRETAVNMSTNFFKFFMKQDSTLLLCTQSCIFRFKKKVPPRALFTETVEGVPQPLSCRALTEDDNKNIYASYYTGISKKAAGSKKFIQLPTQQYIKGPLLSTYSLNYYKGYLLWNNVKIDLSSGRHTYMFDENFSGHTAQYLNHDTVWLFKWGTNELHCYDLLKDKLTSFSIDKNLTGISYLSGINDITEGSSANSLWIATSDDGLALITKEGKLLKKYSASELGISDNYITCLQMQNNNLWFGSKEGLGVLNIAANKITLYKNPLITANNVMQNRSVFSIITDSLGNFYLGTGGGLVYFNIKDDEFYNLPEGHPLSNIEFNRASFLKASDGRFYFGSIDGLYSFLPSQLEFIKSSNKLQPIQLVSVAVFSNSQNQFRYISQNLDSLTKLQLEPGDNNIELIFSLPEFTKKVYYSYRIKGQANQWTEYKPDNKILLYGLLPGSYTLEVKASTTLNDENAVYFSLPVTMQQVWYKKSWVVILFFVAAIGFITTFLRYRYSEKLKRQKSLAALRTKISSDLHDDVGSILSGLAMQSQMLTYSANEEQRESLLEISGMSRDAMERMRDTVWAMDNRKDKLENLIDRMRDFAEKSFSLKKITHQFVIDITDSKKFIDPEKRQQVYLIFKEAVTNIIKHSNGTHVQINFTESKNNLKLVIHDNGTAKTSGNSDGLGISNMKMRAEKIGGMLTAKYENGFVVELDV